MASTLYLFLFMRFILLLHAFHFIFFTESYSSGQSLCHNDERAALLQFNHSLSLNKYASYIPFAYPKVASWKLEGESSDCCTWDGVECDPHTGHVIGLELNSSFLYGSIDSNSSLFGLVHLQTLNLADNNFNYSKIPLEISRLSKLSTLNLSYSFFSGQIPSEISGLSKLVSLDLSSNYLEKPSLRSIAQNLTNLKELHLSGVDISARVPDNLSNLTSLRSLFLRNCGLYGEFPATIFQLPNLEILIAQENNNLTGSLPEFHQSSPLKILRLRTTSFSGVLPNSIGNLSSLNMLDFSDCQFSGEIPSCLTNMTQLTYIDLSSNQLRGQIPSSFSQLKNLDYLSLDYNNLSGTVEVDVFLSLKKLTLLDLGGNHITLLTNNRTNGTLPRFRRLALDSCNLTEFPHFIRFQDELEVLDLFYNQIRGEIPEWVLNISKAALESIDLDNNMLEGFEKLPKVLPWVALVYLDLSHNVLQGPIPIPSPNIFDYRVSSNSLTGEIPSAFCSMSYVFSLDLSNNGLRGIIPPCFGNLSSLSVLNLKGNKFSGNIRHPYGEGNNLRMLDLSENQLEGQLPRSLANCTNLEFLHLGDNQIEDTFPFWLGGLQELKVLVLRSNRFHGVVEGPTTNEDFPELRVIDLSNNAFSSLLPLGYFKIWNAMKILDVSQVAYLQVNVDASIRQRGWSLNYDYSMTITNKAVKTNYQKILNVFTVINLSFNKFKGEIPESIGNLKALQSLNLSNNDLIGHIPLSLGQLSQLESLDLCRNKLSGVIPLQLVMLNFLAILNVSYNNFSGPIPNGKQFDTFQNDSYKGSSSLCGQPLSKRCGDPGTTPPLTVEQGDDFKFPSRVDWIVKCLGYGSGLVVGVIGGRILTTRYHEWFLEKFGKRKANRRRRRKRGQRG